MRKKISFMVFSNAGASARQFTVSALLVRILIVSALVLVGIVGYDYSRLRFNASQSHDHQIELTSQSEEIIRQRQQIQEFAEEISALKSKLVELNAFEKKIRIIANIEKPHGQDGVFGVGGSIPEDLDTHIPLNQRHNSLLRDMHEQVDQLHSASANQNKGFESLYKYLSDQQNLLACTPAIRPTRGWTTSRFGYRTSPFTGRREFHKGYDIANRIGTRVIAPADGVVTFTGPKGFLGRTLIIDHGHGLVTRYGHLKEAIKKRGERVRRGETIALMGNTGRSTGPHLHYEVHLNGIPVNPEKYILN